jgi:hypothetical protein
MDLVTRYVRAVGSYLPEHRRRDIEAELESLISDTRESREEELGRELTEEELAALIRKFGRPIATAAAHLGNRSLISEAWFPTFMWAAAIAVGVALLLTLLEFMAEALSGAGRLPSLWPLAIQLVDAALTTFAVVTIAFAIADRGSSGPFDWGVRWDPRNLRPFAATDHVKTSDSVYTIIFSIAAIHFLTSGSDLLRAFGIPNELHGQLIWHEVAVALRWPLLAILVARALNHGAALILRRWRSVTRHAEAALDVLLLACFATLLLIEPIVALPANVVESLANQERMIHDGELALNESARITVLVLALIVAYDLIHLFRRFLRKSNEDDGRAV